MNLLATLVDYLENTMILLLSSGPWRAAEPTDRKRLPLLPRSPFVILGKLLNHIELPFTHL